MKTKQTGFTLVEIAIVLVIIGLLLGGILKGQEMITQAKIKNVVNDFNGITAAVNSYRDRYRAMPGDDLGAAGRWTGAVSGNGDGVIQGLYGAPSAASYTQAMESNLFWWHLRLAGFVAGATTGQAAGQQPSNAANGIMGVETGVTGTNGLGFTSTIICESNLPDKIAIAVDAAMDDGSPSTGQVRAQLQTATNPASLPATNITSGYQETGTNNYLLCKNM
jgi:prepilin-type N-terminal cleavage/methylation domain-containing protein